MAAKAGIRVITEKQTGNVFPDRFGSGKGNYNMVRRLDKVKEAEWQEILSSGSIAGHHAAEDGSVLYNRNILPIDNHKNSKLIYSNLYTIILDLSHSFCKMSDALQMLNKNDKITLIESFKS